MPNYQCTICKAVTAPTGACRGCGAPSKVDGRSTRRIGPSEIQLLRKLLDEACDLAEEANGDPSSCSYIVPVGDRIKEIRKEAKQVRR